MSLRGLFDRVLKGNDLDKNSGYAWRQAWPTRRPNGRMTQTLSRVSDRDHTTQDSSGIGTMNNT
jgi:hypothetical protein